MKKLKLLGLIIILAGCTASNLRQSTPSPTQTEHLCSGLKRNLIFNTTSGPLPGTASATQRAEMVRLYHKYNCSKLEKASK